MASERRLEILGILLIAISVFLLFSLLGYNPNEEPSISPKRSPWPDFVRPGGHSSSSGQKESATEHACGAV